MYYELRQLPDSLSFDWTSKCHNSNGIAIINKCRPGNHPFTQLAGALLVDTALKEEYTAHIKHTDAKKLLEANLRRCPLGLHEILRDSPFLHALIYCWSLTSLKSFFATIKKVRWTKRPRLSSY